FCSGQVGSFQSMASSQLLASFIHITQLCDNVGVNDHQLAISKMLIADKIIFILLLMCLGNSHQIDKPIATIISTMLEN
ncbi:hypothetical protein BMS77_09490, partial [Leuconostoc pseudomesenteroides]